MQQVAKLGLKCSLAAATAAALIAGCGGGGGGGVSTPSGSGQLSLTLADAPPSPSISAVNITIDRVEANVSGTWAPISSVPKSFNLLDLVKNDAVLGSASLPAGHYTQVRFFPSNATVTDQNGTSPLTIPSGAQTGVKVNVDYDIGPNQITTVLLDFNVQKSIVRQGNGGYLLQPVIPAVVKVLSGTIVGSVLAAGSPVQGATVTATYTAGPNYPAGTAVNTSGTLADGTFKVWALLPGVYAVNVSFTDTTTNMTTTAVKTGIAVAANQSADAGPFNLA